MDQWIRGTAALLAGGPALFWQPGLKSAQDSITSYIDLTGQVVTLVWLTLTFGWILLLESIAYVCSDTLLFLLRFQP